jgi:DNA-binding MarR family transcriptional regulator
MYPMRYVTSQADLTPNERVVYGYLTKQGFVTLQRIVEATGLTKQDAMKALEGLNGQNFILNEQGKVSLNVHAKQVLGFYANK